MGMAFLGAMKDMDEKVIEEALRAMRDVDKLDMEDAEESDDDQDVELASMNGKTEKNNKPRS